MANQAPTTPPTVQHSCCWCSFKWKCSSASKDSHFCKCQWQEIGSINDVRQILYWCSPACQDHDMNDETEEEEEYDDQMFDDGHWHSWK